MLQLFGGINSYSPYSITISEEAILGLLVLLVLAGAITAALFMYRAILHGKNKINQAQKQVLLRVLVPKERKSEGQGGKVDQEDRLDQVKEEIAISESFFATMAAIKKPKGFKTWLHGRDDNFSFEIVMNNGLIYFYIHTLKKYQQFVEQQIHAQFSSAQIEVIRDYNIFHEKSTIVGSYLTMKNKGSFPIKTYKKMDSDPLSAVLNVLARIREQNSTAAIQFVVRSSDDEWRKEGGHIVREVKSGKKFEKVTASPSKLDLFFRKMHATIDYVIGKDKKDEGGGDKYQISPMEEEMIKGIEEKISKGGFEVTIRLLSVSDSESMAQNNLNNLVNAFGQYNLYRYGNSFSGKIPKKQNKLIRDFIYRSFNDKLYSVVNTEELASLWHLPLHSTETPNIKWLSGRRSAPPSNIPQAGLFLGEVVYRGGKTGVYMKEADRRRHLYVVGKSGSGKSVFVSNLAIQDIKNGHGVGIIDPHGDLVEDVLAHVPKERADDVIIFNPSDFERPIGLNMLEPKTEEQKDFAVQEMIAIFYKLFPPEMIGPMFEHNMRNVMLTLMADINNPGTIIDIPRMFTDDDYVKVYLKKLEDPVVRAFWEKEMAKTSDYHKSEMLGYLVSKVGRFVGNEMMRNIMGQQKSGFDFRDVMDKKKILLVNLSKGKTGEVNSKLLGLIIVAKLQMAAMGRADIAEDQRHDFYLYIDEFQNFITDSISTILSEARKYRLDLIIAHQYMNQLVDDKGKADVRDAVLGNVGTICVGRIGPDDAEILAKEFVPTFGSYDLLNPPPFSYYTKMLIDGKASRPFNMNSMPPKEGNKELAAAIKQLSRLKYGRDKRIVVEEILERSQLGVSSKKSKLDMIEASL